MEESKSSEPRNKQPEYREKGRKQNTSIALHITNNELSRMVRRIRSKFLDNPQINLDLLSDLGIVIASIGIVKDYPALRLLGDLFLDLPDKVRPLFSLRYSLIGTIGEVQALAEDVTREVTERITNSLEEIELMMEKDSLDEHRLLKIIGTIYDLVNVKIPSLVAITEEE